MVRNQLRFQFHAGSELHDDTVRQKTKLKKLQPAGVHLKTCCRFTQHPGSSHIYTLITQPQSFMLTELQFHVILNVKFPQNGAGHSNKSLWTEL